MSDNKNPEDYRLERIKQEYQEFIGLIDEYMDLKRWGFVQTYSRVVVADVPFAVIYNSEWCRVRFNYEPRDQGYYIEREVSVKYGRLHVPNDGRCVNSKGKEANCWHFIWNLLDFLDGLSPQAVVDRVGQGPQLVRKFDKTYPSWETWGDPRTAYVIKGLRLHNEIWEYYEQKLFAVFDLRNPVLWDKYVQYHNEIKRLQYETRKAKEKVGKPFKQFDDFVPDELW